MPRDYDVIIIGGGHAGAEAAWAAAGLDAAVALVTFDPKRIGAMSCNPAIGGLAKGQMVREIDALGGLMGLATDATGIQFRMLNRSKGPAVWGPRAQSDKYRYAAEVQRLLAGRPGLDIIAGEVDDIITDPPSRRIAAVALKDGRRLNCRAVVVTTGTFLRALMHTGESQTPGGRVGESAATGLSTCLTRLGLELGRLKTGTPPRLSRASIDFGVFEQQPGDDEPMPFSFLNEYAVSRDPEGSACRGGDLSRHPKALPSGSRLTAKENPWRPPLPQVHCWLSATNAAIHDLIRANLHRAPMYSGQISSVGPRYCPSIEDKVVRFADKPAHQIFLEPEGLDTDEIYCNGISTSLPADVQEKIIRLIPGLEKARILRFGYAVEYDMVWPSQIRSTLETKRCRGLFLAGQINGTSGYEEAAAQGLVAGINAARLARGVDVDFVLRRDQAYIGVLVDDLTTKPPIEPYRMFTSRAEHRLHLRSDNADDRLTPAGRQIGLVDDTRWSGFLDRRHRTESALALLAQLRIDADSALDYLRQSQTTWPMLLARFPAASAIAPDIARQIDIRVKYEGYIARQDRLIAQQAQWEEKLIPPTFDYSTIVGLRNEARQKLTKFTPRSLGQALRISGVTPADVTVLAIHLEHRRRQESGV